MPALLVLALMLSGCFSDRNIETDGPGITGPIVPGGRALRTVGNGLSDRLLPDAEAQRILAVAYSKMGLPYRYGGTSPDTGFDCSGFTQWVFAQNEIGLPRTPAAQLATGAPVSRDELQPGDLVFFRSSYLHVGIYAGDGIFIHSPHTGDRIKESQVFDRYHTKHFAGARRIINDSEAAPLPEDIKDMIVSKARQANGVVQPAKTKKKAGAAPAPKTTAQKKKAKPETRKVYVVKSGDTIWKVARRFGVAKKDLLRANGLKENHVLRIGQKLTLPRS